MRRLVIATVLGAALATPAFAADEQSPALNISAAAVAAAANSAAPAASPELATRSSFSYRRPPMLPALYATSAALQGYDTFSTLSAMRSGAREANPLMKGVVKSPAAFVAMKAGVTAGSIMAAEQLWKSHHRMGAVGMMIASNVMMGIVAAHNSHVLSQLK
jgi:uncharacterized protein DUF5658